MTLKLGFFEGSSTVQKQICGARFQSGLDLDNRLSALRRTAKFTVRDVEGGFVQEIAKLSRDRKASKAGHGKANTVRLHSDYKNHDLKLRAVVTLDVMDKVRLCCPMIVSFRDKRTREFAGGKYIKAFSGFSRQAEMKLDQLEAAASLKDLAALPGNRFEALKGDRKG